MAYEGRALPRIHARNLGQRNTGDGLVAGVAVKLSVLTANNVRVSAPGSLSGLTFRAFSMFGI